MPKAEKSKKARVRRTAPTIRERAEKAQTKELKPKRRSKVLKAFPARKVLSRIKPRHNSATRTVAKPFKPLKRPLKFIGRWIFPRYITNSFKEVRLVTWPGRRDTWRMTGAVFIFALIFGGAIAIVDKVLDVVFKNLILK